MNAKYHFWQVMAEVVYYKCLVDAKIALNSKIAMILDIFFTIISSGALGVYLVYHQNLALVICIISQCYQACHALLPFYKDKHLLFHSAFKLDMIFKEMEELWYCLDKTNEDEIWKQTAIFDKRIMHETSRLYREGIGFLFLSWLAGNKRDKYLERFYKDKAFKKPEENNKKKKMKRFFIRVPTPTSSK